MRGNTAIKRVSTHERTYKLEPPSDIPQNINTKAEAPESFIVFRFPNGNGTTACMMEMQNIEISQLELAGHGAIRFAEQHYKMAADTMNSRQTPQIVAARDIPGGALKRND